MTEQGPPSIRIHAKDSETQKRDSRLMPLLQGNVRVEILRSKEEMGVWRRAGVGTVALVPTMGCFHEGHLSLMKKARDLADNVVVSLFVNPIQFGPEEDLNRYPRDFDSDIALASGEGVDCLFAPPSEEMYKGLPETFVYWPRLGKLLCGKGRPNHFRGVGTVVLKLFNIVKPDVALFGRKDGQQGILIKRLVEELDIGIEIVICPTVREPDSLAKSSRNQYLSPDEKKQALGLYRSLSEAKEIIENGVRDSEELRTAMKAILLEFSGLDMEYLEIVSRETFDRIKNVTSEIMIAVAGKV